MSMDKVQLKQEELLDGQVVLSDINPVTNTKSIEDSANGLPMTETISRMWSAINNKLSRIVNSVNGRTGVVVLTSEDVGLGNVDNVSYEEIKQWVLDTFDELFGEGHFRLYASITEAKVDAAAHGKEYNNIPFYAKSGEPITKDIDGVTQLIQDYRAYIGYFVWNASTGHVDIGDMKAINVVGWSDNSIVYVKDEDETFRGNTTPLPIGGIGVNIHVQEDALFVRNPDGIKSESGLAIDKSKVVPRVYYFSQIYRGHDTTYTKPEYPDSVYINPAHNGFLWDEGQGTPYRGPEISIMIDGVTASGTHYLQLDSAYHVADYRVGDLIICNFNGEFSDRGTESNVRLVPEQSDKQFVFRNTSIGVITSAPSLDHPDDPYSVSFNAILPRVGYGLRLIDTHQDDVVHDKEIALYIANSGNSTPVFNATPFNTRKDVNTEQNPSGVKDPLSIGWEPNITIPWDYDEGGNTGTRVTINGGLFMEMDKTLCLMPMNMVRAGNRTVDDEGPVGAEYKFIDYGDARDRMTRPYGSRIAGNWHHPYIYHDDDDPTEAYSNNKTLLSVNLTKIIRDDTVPSHGSYRSFYNVSGLRVDWGTDVAYNGRDESHNNRVVNGLHNIINAFSSENGRNYFGLIDGYDSAGSPYKTLVPRFLGKANDVNFMKFSGGISVNIGRFLEIRPAVTYNSQEYYDGGKVQLRAGHGTEETSWYRIMLGAGARWGDDYVARPASDYSNFMKFWEADPDNTDPDYQFYCVPKFVASFLVQPKNRGTNGIEYNEWLSDEEPFLRNNIVDVPTVSEFELIEDSYFPLTDEDPPLGWFNSSYTSYFAKDVSTDTFSRIEGIPDPRYTPSGLRGPDYHANKYYRFAPPDWPVSIPVSSSDESYDAYNVTFPNDTTQSPFDVVVTAKYADGTREYHEIFFTKQGDKYVPVNFTVTDVVDEYPIRDKYVGYEWHKTSPEFQPGTFYRLKRKRVDPEVLSTDYAIVWKQPTNRLGFKPDRETLKINPDGSVGVLTAVTQYKKGSVYHKNQMVESGGKVYICVKDYLSSTYDKNVHDTVIAENMPSMYTDTPTYVSPGMYGATDNIYYAESVQRDMELGYLSNRFSMDAVVEWEQGQSYAFGQLVQYMGYLYLVIKSYGDYKSISIEDDIDNGYLSDAFNTGKRKILYFRDVRGRSFEFDPMGTIKQRNNEEKYANDPTKLRRLREYEYVKLGPGLRITGGSLPPEVECNRTELRASLLEEVERISVAEEIMYARTLDPTFGCSSKFEYQDTAVMNAEAFVPGQQYHLGKLLRFGSYVYMCIKNYDADPENPYYASDSAVTDMENGYLTTYDKIYDNAGTIEGLTSIEDVINMDESFLATIETVGENVDEAIIKNTILSKDSTLVELRTFKATLDTIRMQLEDPNVFFPMNKEFLLDDWRTLQNRVRSMVLTANNKKDSTELYQELVQKWFGNGSTVQPTFKAIQAATSDFIKVEIRTLEWLFTTWATKVRNSSELAATFIDDQNNNKCDYCACGDSDVVCNHECAHCTKNPENNENAYWAYVQIDVGDTHDAVVYDSLNTETHRELFRIPYGTRTVCIPLNASADWVKVALNGQVGYALKSSFKLAQVFSQIPETVITASVNIFDTYDTTGRGITLYNDNMTVSDETKLGVFHTYVTNIPRSTTQPDERGWEILNSDWTQITLMNDDGNGYTTGYVETARMIFT